MLLECKTSIQVRFVGSALNPRKLQRQPLPEIIFLGRSNVGKSSLINCLVKQKNLARTSSTPGKTRLFFFYEIDNRILFVDPPGYGYAKASAVVRSRWVREMERYLRKSEFLLGVVLIMDIRHAPTPIDYNMALWLAESKIPTIYVLNKADKLSRSQRMAARERISGKLSFPGSSDVILFSSVQKEGIRELWKVIDGWLNK